MDILNFDPDVLNSTAEVIELYCYNQIELINDYLNNINSLSSEWSDDQTFGSLIEEVKRLKSHVESLMNDIVSRYPAYFKEKANLILSRPSYNNYSPTTPASGMTKSVTTTNSNNENSNSKTLIYNTDSKSLSKYKYTILSDSDKEQIMNETGWSKSIVDGLDVKEQVSIYMNAGLHESNVNGRNCLIKDIDYEYTVSPIGLTNRELMSKGNSPYDSKTGEKIELHHMGQKYDGAFAELNANSEHGSSNHAVLHLSRNNSWRNDSNLKYSYAKEKRNYWKARSKEK